jgi:hypothetical protein
MKVRATKLGFDGLRRQRPGDEFEIPDEPKGPDGMPKLFSKNWMEVVEKAPAKPEEPEPKPVAVAPEAEPKPPTGDQQVI